MEKAFGFDFVSTYGEWLSAVRNQLSALRAVDDYLTERGRDFLKALRELESVSEFADSAADAIKLIGSDSFLVGESRDLLKRAEVSVIVHRLRIIAEDEARAVQLPFKL